MNPTSRDIANRLWGNARLYAQHADSRMQSDKHASMLAEEVDAAVVKCGSALLMQLATDERAKADETIGMLRAEIKSLKRKLAEAKKPRLIPITEE